MEGILLERRKAAALKYKEGTDLAPKVVASGVGKLADKIIEKAEENNVPVVYNKELTELLTNVDIGDHIPPELYEAVAHIIAYITEIDGEI
ncbi:EscU/YscU/HrcU family type III secretion system export apparatus switch protein [Clostridium sp.]|uniref:EscU/YscU/HrcU family type III secretion system export apparatus switch protein n=1 Tax=Clostridium sp. TaxID=1506 RepID=UPI00346467BE